MSTTPALAVHEDSSLTRTVAKSVNTIRHVRGVRVPQIAEWLDISRGAVYERLKGATPFTLADIEVLARELQVAPEVFLHDPEDRIFPKGTRDTVPFRANRHLSLVSSSTPTGESGTPERTRKDRPTGQLPLLSLVRP